MNQLSNRPNTAQNRLVQRKQFWFKVSSADYKSRNTGQFQKFTPDSIQRSFEQMIYQNKALIL